MTAVLNGKSRVLDEELLNLTLYGVGVYSSFVVETGKVRGWEQHIGRLIRDAREFLGLQIQRDDLVESLKCFLKHAGAGSDAITCRITVFPGSYSLGAPQEASNPQILVTGRSGSSLTGLPLKLSLIECERPFAEYKITNISAAMKWRGEAKLKGFDDPLFYKKNLITEGPTWNIFFVKEDEVFMPELNGDILPGVTRMLLSTLDGASVISKDIEKDSLGSYDSAFVTNSAIGLVPVESIDNYKFSTDHQVISEFKKKYLEVSLEEIK